MIMTQKNNKGYAMSLLSDVEVLKKAPMPEVRETIASKVAQYFNAGIFDSEEVEVAADIVRLLAKDAEIRVRKTLSEALKSNPNLPHDIALGMAQDEIEVANPILEFSNALTEGDLIEIIRSTQQVAKLKAISRREGVTETVSSALIHTRNPEVTESLFENVTAIISEESYQVALKEFQNNGSIINVLINRGGLPIGVAEKMIHFVSGKMKDKLTDQYNLSGKTAESLTEISRERATLQLLDDEPEQKTRLQQSSEEAAKYDKVESLIKHLQREDRLTQSIVLRSLCEGNLKFFEASIAVMAGTSILNARTLIRDKNPAALKSLCKRASLPSSIFAATQIILSFLLEEDETGRIKMPGFKQRLLEHITSQDFDKNVPLMPYILALISSKVETHDLV